ncbi:putative phosphohistidine phosphatase, SixA [Parvibaculum lavamentivorans DS-1]|uniref:Putative phosphohistidine phosphatase, SixA n=1 Tax=Parvibaculum lavamentivorans (strain DS-1 / DSM 13023 / NCIMB 13966) TaxID=402881 RepID=A7HQ66_PARL1|nr:histidine phosphatase family protein [Parvibaculum lavamentivorans]ABS62049.1 putative phosphohistidine phosphatase, SixA [Parvibaculum lavamentivorans DS-1]
MKRLCLMRHAKSDWSDPANDDFTRPLNARGTTAAAFMARYIAASPYRPDAVLCSTAARATQTCMPLCDALGPNVPVVYRDELYHAMPDTMLTEIRRVPANVETLLVVAHNPGLVLLAMALAEDPDDETALRIAHGVPTGGFIVIDFDIDAWTDIRENAGRPEFFVRPRDLMTEGAEGKSGTSAGQ